MDLGTVRAACREHGVKMDYEDRGSKLANKTYRIIRELILRQRQPEGERATLVKLAKRYGISKQRIGQIAAGCEAAGLFDL